MLSIPGILYYKMLLKVFAILSPIQYKFIGSLGDSVLDDFRNKFKYTDFNVDINVIHIEIFLKSVLYKLQDLHKLMSDKKSKEKVSECINIINNYLILLNKDL